MTSPRRATRRFRTGAMLLCAPLALMLLGARHCHPGMETPYRLALGSALIEGCIDGPCLCPVSFAELAGGFTLTELATFGPGPARLFAIEDVAWRAGIAEYARRIQGEGFYENDLLKNTQRMVLSLRIDGGPTRIFDSGLVEGGREFPKIAISIRLNGAGSCFDIIFDLRAVPTDFPGLDCRENADCAAGDYCRKPAGQCAEAGVCEPRGDVCPAVVDPVCGCDGGTYGNDCEAGRSGVSVDARGPCV